MLRLVFYLALRQAEGFGTGVLGQELRVPDHTTPRPAAWTPLKKPRSLGVRHPVMR